jgi:crotonobetainyl-CoA:carnitine CoA-transferase CaiB-like acyl-CoA transferase
MFVMAQLPKFWTVLVERIGRPDLAEDPRFRSPTERLSHRDALTETLDAVFGTAPTAHWLERLQGHMPVAPVHDVAAALDSAFIAGTGMVDAVPHPDRDGLRVLASPIRLDGERLPNRAGPLLGADSDAVLAEAGLSRDEIADLRANDIV